MNSYIAQGFILSLLTVFLPTLVGLAITRKKVAITLIISLIFGAIYAVVWALINWGSSSGFFAPAPYFFSALIGFLFGMFACLVGRLPESERDSYGETNGVSMAMLPGALCALIALISMIWIGAVNSSDAWGNAKPKAGLIGKIDIVTDLNKALTTADTAKICLVDEDMATVGAQNALSKFKVSDGGIPGSRYEIGKPTKQYFEGHLWWVFPVEFQGWLKWRMNPQVPGYLRVSAEDPFAEAEAVQINKQGEEISIKYLNSACWEYLAERHLRYNGYMHKILIDWTFEPDDNLDPFYTVTVAQRKFGYEGLQVIGLVTLNLQTGEINFYDVSKVPNWVDRVIPLEIIDYNVEKWGLYSVEGFWYNLWHDDKSQKPTPGWYLTYDEKQGAQWFSGFTSTSNKDQAMTGFVLTNARNASTRFFKANGVTEEKAYQAARSLWSNFEGYEPSELVPYNFSGVMTYVIPMKFRSQYAGVSLVSLANVNVKAMGKTLDEALANYKGMHAKTAGGRFAPEGADAEKMSIKGIVKMVGLPIMKGQETFFPFMLEGVNKRFQVSDSFNNPEAVFLAPGLEVICEYVGAGASIIICEKFDITSIVLTDENPAQARMIENQEKTQAEIDRIKEADDCSRLIESNRLKDVDPKKLEEFLKNQNNQ
jgi:hypothetical protein